jgi:hypothetical protein
MRTLPLPSTRPVALAVAAVLALVVAVLLVLGPAGTSQAAGHAGHGGAPNAAGQVGSAKDGEQGTTGGWYDGRDVTLRYNKPFYCDTTVFSGASSGCTVGAEPQVPPRGGDVPVLYVMVPLAGTGQSGATSLQCPETGSCINHPATLDLSAVFGPGTEDAPLPPHSHVVDVKHGGWWELEVVGVTDAAAWDALVAGKDLRTVRELQAAGQATPDIPTNSFLFFNVAG